MDRSFGIAAGRRLSVALLVFAVGLRARRLAGGLGRLGWSLPALRDGTYPGLSGLAAPHRRERRSEGSRLLGAEPARLRSARLRALGEHDDRRPAAHRR